MNVKMKTLKNVTKLISNVAIIDVFLEDGVAIMMMIVVSCNFFKIWIVAATIILKIWNFFLGDNSDEIDCLDQYRNCSESEVTCSDGKCIHESKFCDGTPDCEDTTDELFCTTDCDLENQFQCESPPFCIHNRWKCDGDRDCSDGSDEKNCTKSSCPPGEFSCSSINLCINSQWICDGADDCGEFFS